MSSIRRLSEEVAIRAEYLDQPAALIQEILHRFDLNTPYQQQYSPALAGFRNVVKADSVPVAHGIPWRNLSTES